MGYGLESKLDNWNEPLSISDEIRQYMNLLKSESNDGDMDKIYAKTINKKIIDMLEEKKWNEEIVSSVLYVLELLNK